MRRNGWLAVGIGLILVAGRLFADVAIDSLSVIPGDAVGFICIPSPQELDADIQSSINKLGLGGMVPLPGNSVLSMLEAQLPPLKKMDVKRPLVVAFMPAESLQGLNDSQGMLIPCDDPQALIDELNGKQSDGEIWNVNVMGTELQAAVRENHVILARGAKLAQSIKDSSQSMADSLPRPVRDGMADLDLIVGINLAELSAMVTPLIERQLFPLLESQANSEMEKQSVKINKRQIMQLVEGMETMVIGLRLESAGLALRFAGSVKAGSELARSTYMRVTDAPLLEGLPAGQWAVASGQVADEAQMQAQYDNLEPMFEVYKSAEGVDQKKVSALQESLKKWLLGSRGYQMSITTLDDDSNGVIGVNVIAQCEDSQKWLQLTEETVQLGRELASSADNEAAEFFEAFRVNRSDGMVAMEIDLSQIDEIDDDQQEIMENVLGAETIVRMKAVGTDRVLMSFGGGAERLAALEQAMQQNGRDDSDGMQQVAEFLPASRNSVTYVFVDRTIDLVRRVLVAMDEEDLPFATPQVDVPVAVTGTGGDNWWRADLVVPLEVIAAGRDIAMTMMGQ